jgi:hypothetical protein
VPDFIKIQRDLVQVIREEVVKETQLADFLPHIEFRPAITMGLLPKTAIFVHWDESDPKNKRAQMLAELSPAVRTCTYISKRYQISIPWTYFLFDWKTAGDPMNGASWTNDGVRVYWSKTQITKITDELATALVPNCDSLGRICFGNTYVDAALPLGVRVDRTVDDFYRTIFMHTNGAGSPWQSETRSDTWIRWAQETKKNPAAFLDFPEWSKTLRNNPMKFHTVQSILGTEWENKKPIMVEGMIPDIPSVMTFLRAEEWLDSVSPQNRHKLLIALQNKMAENPGAVEVAPDGPEDTEGIPV